MLRKSLGLAALPLLTEAGSAFAAGESAFRPDQFILLVFLNLVVGLCLLILVGGVVVALVDRLRRSRKAQLRFAPASRKLGRTGSLVPIETRTAAVRHPGVGG
ncbi:hypothetical protein JCM30471_18720 [Desulfuromonas carbonis]|uniref:hypothetical protein n=1 Tax=Desulfuromonas sp. DDH964 TaxID=1823759 RepID=UPI00078C1568|nr:hypothetical protein [Desulfuromonas sp. DDH964]AMV73456.1 hypothetical protein DBW_3149 [Desulfuromonas sp. DDH964]